MLKKFIPDEFKIEITMTTHEEEGDLVVEKEYTIDRERLFDAMSQIADYILASAHHMTIGQLVALVTQIWEIVVPHIQQDRQNESGKNSCIDED